MATYETAVDQNVKVGDIVFTYRRLGQSQGVPLVLLMGFRYAWKWQASGADYGLTMY